MIFWVTVFLNALLVQTIGTIRLAWLNINADCRVMLFCPSNADGKAYTYHQKSEEYGSKALTSAVILVDRPKWFNEA
ncbi:MAG TPA: hypothetical protein DD001_00825 [Microcoleaceae bacterium UBA10368]|jgi:hypothetical protein|nr:hypothetical protein [Microcoleaceae cyanobacterium UBA10368]HCV32383.1 hypothetical protein [Microcoleaceae cyanobacterium UBA9251]